MKRDPWSKRKNLYSSPIPKVVSSPKVKWRVWPILWMAVKKTCMLIGATVLVISILVTWTFSSVVEEMNVRLPSQMVLFVELNGDLGDLPKEVSFTDPFTSTGKTIKTFIEAIERAKLDPRVEGLYARLNPGGYALAHIQEMRSAIKDFRDSGKFAYIYSPSYSNGLGGYYLAASFDEIWMQPMGSVMITGLNAEMPFLRNVLDKVGIEPQFFQRKEYKNAYESLTNSEMSKENRLAMQTLVTDISDVLTADISKDMGMTDVEFRELVDRGLFLSSEALEVGLIDKADYADKLVEQINTRVTGNPKSEDLAYINFDTYIGEMTEQNKTLAKKLFKEEAQKTSPRVALIYAVGAIMDTDGNKTKMPTGIIDDGIAAADEIAGALLSAAYDKDIDSVVLRVDSPGGSPVASETILRAVEKVQEEGKTVTVSMGPTAASGGYWIASLADHIFVLPTTITGSIGVLGGKVSAEQLWKNVGVNWDSISWGKNSAMWSINKPFSESEAERMNAMLDNIYDGFLERVAKGRSMSVEDVDKIARGRIWVGTSAVKIGIADQFGGLNEALDYAAIQAGGTSRHDVEVLILPKPLSPLEKFIELLEGQVRAGEILGIQAAFLKELQPIITEFMIMKEAQSHSVYNPIKIR